MVTTSYVNVQPDRLWHVDAIQRLCVGQHFSDPSRPMRTRNFNASSLALDIFNHTTDLAVIELDGFSRSYVIKCFRDGAANRGRSQHVTISPRRAGSVTDV